MIYFRYTVLAIIAVLMQITNFVLAPVIALFINKEGYLPKWLSWFQTQDAPAVGDKMYEDREMAFTKKYPAWLSRYVRGVCWGQRNPGYGFSYFQGLKVSKIEDYKMVGQDIDIGDFGYILGKVTRTCVQDGRLYFNVKCAGKWNEKYGWMTEFGWRINGVDQDQPGQVRSLAVDIRPRILLVPPDKTVR